MNASDVVEDGKPFLVVTGSSAGGIDALGALVGSLSQNLIAPVVIAQHLDPSHPSHLVRILCQRTSLPVHLATDRQELLPGNIYVVPPNRDVEIVDASTAVFLQPGNGPKPSIDRFFASAAAIYSDRLIAVILSGMGSDGMAGARVVKENGGTVIIQDPETAPFPSMPLAISPGLVDFTAAPEQIGNVVEDLLRGAMLPDAERDQATFYTLLTHLRDRSGIDFLQYKPPTIMRRLSRLMVASGTTSINGYMRYLQAHPDGYQRLVSSFLIKVTEFFRDSALFEQLREAILPRLIQVARERSGELRIWSAGTSTGEEAYSLAILCAELLRESGETVTVRIFATDLDEEAVSFARRGIYGAESLQHVPAAWIERYFVRTGDGYEVSKRIRNMTVFGQHDLAQRAPFPRIDLCTCRNVLIYFTKELQLRALHLFAFALRQGGLLVLGKAESTNPLPEYFRPINAALKIYERHGERVLIPPTQMRDATGANPDARGAGKAGARVLQTVLPQRGGDARTTHNEVMGALVAMSGVGVVLVDRQYDVIAMNASARAQLDIHGLGLGEDLIHLIASLDAQEIRQMIDAAFRGEKIESREVRGRAPGQDGERWLRISCYPERAPRAAQVGIVGLLMIDCGELVEQRQALERDNAEKDRTIQKLSTRVAELAERQRILLVANDELTSANADLRSQNEQLLIGAEEVASSNEEIETLNEEMQATNEELETLNEELQATVEELNTTNDELESRSWELEHTVMQRNEHVLHVETERGLLAAVLSAIGDPVVVLNAAGEPIFKSSELRELESFAHPAADLGKTRVVQLSNGRSYEARSQPICGPQGEPLIVVAFRPVN
ncbi:MAG TPA: CheR family methyltransferase [Candidatus Acidoferrales bacterium]|nr:CheR family methyltransferase [Candidatus Acidoferrales bacterium]